MPDVLVLGLDIGGTSTRAVLATPAGTRVGEGRAGGGNPVAHDPAVAAAELGRALRLALSGTDPARVRAAVVGLAGAGPAAANARAREAFDQAWRDAGLACGYRLVTDPVVAFAAGTPERDGTVLIAGTGAVAADVRGGAVRRIADGHGWLLGDAGSGFWLGREAVRLTLRALDSGGPLTEISRLVMLELLGSDAVAPSPRDTVSAIIAAVHARPPVALARLAPVVTSSYALGDPDAERLVQDAADHLMQTVGVVRALGEQTPVVLAGSLLSEGTPVAAAVRVRLGATWPESALAAAAEPAAGAAWLASLDADPVDPAQARARHRRFTGG